MTKRDGWIDGREARAGEPVRLMTVEQLKERLSEFEPGAVVCLSTPTYQESDDAPRTGAHFLESIGSAGDGFVVLDGSEHVEELL